MAILRALSPNYLRDPATNIKRSDYTDPNYPVENFLHPNLYKKVKHTDGYGTYVHFDLGAQLPVQAIAILNHTILESPIIQLAIGGCVNDGPYDPPDSGWFDLTWDAGMIIEFFSSVQTYRYWVLAIDIGVENPFEIGGLVIAPYWQSPYQGYSELTKGLRSVRDGRIDLQTITAPIINLSESDRASLESIWVAHRKVGETENPYQHGSEPTLFCFDVNSDMEADGLRTLSIYGVWPTDFRSAFDPHSYADANLTVEECL